jgi:hypothetical protein
MKDKSNLIKNLIVVVLIFVTVWFGIRPILSRNTGGQNKKINSNDYDFAENEYGTIVIGSEPEGIAAAISCARTGLKTLLITEDDHLGSYISKALISRMNPQQGIIDGKKVMLNEGIYQQIFGRLSLGFSSSEYEKSLAELVKKEKNLTIIYDSHISEIVMKDEYIQGIYVQGSEGKSYYKARNYIDATWNGVLLDLAETPYTKGSEDLGIGDFYAPLEFNFKISGVDVEALKKGKKMTEFATEFKIVLTAYEMANKRTKLVSPSFISQNDDELIISGLQVFGVDLEDEEDLESAYKEAEEEAIMLTAFLKNVLIAFQDCTYEHGPESLFIPEYKHFEGRYTLTVGDILENKDFRNKIALSAQEVDASKFIKTNLRYVVTKPNVYSIPLGSIVPVNLQNVIMVGSKAGFTSLASTSAGNIPTRITVGEAAGLVSAYSVISGKTPAQLSESIDEEVKNLEKYISRGGVKLVDFSESIIIPDTEEKLMDHWAYRYIKVLAEYGLISGGLENDFKLDFEASQEVMVVLIKNAMLKMTPELYNLSVARVLEPYETKDKLNGENAAAIILTSLSKDYTDGNAIQTLKDMNIISAELTDRLQNNEKVTLDIVYGLVVESVEGL